MLALGRISRCVGYVTFITDLSRVGHMISKAERQHLVALKQWSVDGRAGLHTMREHAVIGNLLKKLAPDHIKADTVFDNIDWLIALIEREEHRYGVRALTRLTGTRCCEHPEGDHETVEYRGTDKPRHCLAPGCDCKRFAL